MSVEPVDMAAEFVNTAVVELVEDTAAKVENMEQVVSRCTAEALIDCEMDSVLDKRPVSDIR